MTRLDDDASTGSGYDPDADAFATQYGESLRMLRE